MRSAVRRYPGEVRSVEHRYEDPLDRVWLTCAERVGLKVTRSDEVYAATDGKGTLVIGEGSTLDADDCLAQMIFHELCHSMVQGPGSFDQPDWGLENEDTRHMAREHACLRAQATLATRHGLRWVLAPTTDHRAFYDRLGRDALTGDDEAVRLARRAVARADRRPWDPHVTAALRATAKIVSAVAAYADEGSLFRRVELPLEAHSVAGHRHPKPAGRTCAGCGWRYRVDGDRSAERCRQFPEGAVRLDEPACHRFETAIACGPCGACCREAYDSVELEADDPFLEKHEALVTRVAGRIVLERPEQRCPLLTGDGSKGAPFSCRLYDERPRTCRDFELGGDNCLEARRKVGLSQ